MNRKLFYKHAGRLLIGLLAMIFICLLYQCYRVFLFDKKPITVKSEMGSNEVTVILPKNGDDQDTWETQIRQSDDPEDNKVYTGATYGLDIVNDQDCGIKNWTLKINIQQECYLNGFWCGEFEVHQFRNGKEIVETVSSEDYDLAAMKLEHNKYTSEMMIKLRPGDYLVYLPSEAEGEAVIPAGRTVSFGVIFYSEAFVDMKDNVITYYNYRKITEGSFFRAIVCMFIGWVVITALYAASLLTYTGTKKEVDMLTQSVINGLSVGYKSLWLINVNKREIQLVRSTDETDVSNAIEKAKDFGSYDFSIKYYIDHYVDENDRARVLEQTSLDTLIRHVTEGSFYSVYFLHHSDSDQSSYFQMSFTKTVIQGTDYIILAYRDVDDYVKEEQANKKKLEDALSEANNANRSKSVFLANMSHEIRTPINAILGMDTMILRETKEETVKEYARDIRNASNTLLAIINDILDFSKIESGKMDIVPVKYRLDSMLNDLINMIKPKLDEKGLQFELNINPEIPAQLFGDEIRVKQIIMNILSNAAKYTKKGKVTWTVDYNLADKDTCELMVSVRDTGIGIKPEDKEKLFSPYERLELKKNRTVEGTGLGLSIASNLIGRMGSALEVESVYGEGSTFSFKLKQPIWGDAKVGTHLTESYGDEETVEKFHAPKADILAVDDVEMNLMVIKNLLKRVEIEPVTCLSGREALELSKEKKYDLILLDAMMPELSGEETLKLIREESELNRQTPIVVLTANAIVGAKEEYIALGFNDYLSKPVDGVQLENLIQNYLPKEKIVLPGPEGFENSGKESAEEDPKIKLLDGVDGISAKDGIKASGGEDTYINVCRNFYETAASRMKMIRDYYSARDAENYAIQTHALKSSARLIGAGQLSEMAFEMEKAGKDSAWELIDQNTDILLDMYGQIFEDMKQIFDVDTVKDTGVPKKELTEKKLKRILTELDELIETYDFEYAKELFASLEEYNIPDSFRTSYDSLKGYMAEVDYDNIRKVIEAFLNEE